MSITSPFNAVGNTVQLSATGTTLTPVQVLGNGISPNYRVTNISTQVAFFCFIAPPVDGSTPTLATVIPTAGTPANGQPILGGQSQTFTGPVNAWFSCITSTSTATLYVTPGEGMV